MVIHNNQSPTICEGLFNECGYTAIKPRSRFFYFLHYLYENEGEESRKGSSMKSFALLSLLYCFDTSELPRVIDFPLYHDDGLLSFKLAFLHSSNLRICTLTLVIYVRLQQREGRLVKQETGKTVGLF